MWIYKGTEIDETTLDNYVGFVYIITNLTSGRRYIGKKLLKFSKTKRVKGKKKKFKIASDWKTYYGSAKPILEMLKENKQEEFTREILQFVFNKKLLTYYECKYQFIHGVLENEEWLNSNVLGKFYKTDFN